MGSSAMYLTVETRTHCIYSVYYYFYERSKETILRSRSSKALSTLESMLAGLIAGIFPS